MATFVVEYAQLDGRVKRREVEAPNERGAAAVIETAGHTPIDIQPAEAGGGGAVKSAARRGCRRRGSRRAVLAFTQQLTSVIESGIPLLAGFRVIADQTEHAGLRAALQNIARRIEDGCALAEALEAEPHYFNTIYVKTVAAGEATGHLAEVLEALGRYDEQELENHSQIKSALMYPVLVVGALVLATVVMLVFVVPQFEKMFSKFGADLPLPTRILMGTSSVIRGYWWVCIGGVCAFVYGWKRLFALPGPRRWLDRWTLRLPVFGNILLSGYMFRLVELLNLMNRSSLPIVQGLRITAESVANTELREDVRVVAREVEGGQTLGEAFTRTRWLTPLVKRMLTVGEQAGRTERIFEYLGRYYGTQTQRSIKALSTLVEPVLISGLAAIVLLFSLAIFLPMWRMLKLVGNT